MTIKKKLNTLITKSRKSFKSLKSRKSRKSRNSRKDQKIKQQLIEQFGIYLPIGAVLYKQKKEKKFELRNKFEWFSQIKNYGSIESYGPFIDTYKLIKNMVFFNLGKKNAREFLMQNNYNLVNLSDQDICDEQISGYESNLKFHNNIEDLLNKHGFNGTFVQEQDDSLDCGVTEIVFSPQSSINHKKYIELYSTDSVLE